jgi:hypothetical protein
LLDEVVVVCDRLTRVLYAGGHLGPQAKLEAARSAIVHSIDSSEDISNDATVFRISVTYGVARGEKMVTAPCPPVAQCRYSL